MQAPARPRLLFVVTEDWYFCSHRLPLALAAIDAGYEVALAARLGTHAPMLREQGIALYQWQVKRGSMGMLSELHALVHLWQIYRQFRPDIVHQVALKPALYGSLIAKFEGTRAVVNALGGMGSLFTAGSRRKGALRAVLMRSFKFLLGGPRNVLVLQNDDDASLMINQARLQPETIRLIRGAGVNLEDFSVQPEAAGVPVVVLPARLLWDKGIGEYVEAARLLRAQGVPGRLTIAGGLDDSNPSRITKEQVETWVSEGSVEWLGLRNDMPALLSNAAIVCLPSYREGLPKSLLEAAACGRPIVTTDVPGCRDVVRDGDNGLLVPARNPAALAAALARLLGSPGERARMGARSRVRAATEFSERRVIDETLAIYRSLVPVETDRDVTEKKAPAAQEGCDA